jgi:hypothetical protein
VSHTAILKSVRDCISFFSYSKNVSAVHTPYLPPETNLSRTYSVPALTRVGHHFPCSAQPHRASCSASPSPNPDYVVRRHSLDLFVSPCFLGVTTLSPSTAPSLPKSVRCLPLSSPGARALSDILRREFFDLVCARVYAALMPPGL